MLFENELKVKLHLKKVHSIRLPFDEMDDLFSPVEVKDLSGKSKGKGILSQLFKVIDKATKP